MDTETTKRIIEVEVDQTKAIAQLVEYGNKIKEITAEEKNLQDQLKKGQITQEEYDKKMAAANEVKKEYSRIIRETSKEIQNSLKQDKDKADSLKSLRAELSNATKRYDEMSKAERDSAQGMELLKHIKEVTTQIKGVEEATDRYYRNVGNYKNALIETGAAFKQAGVSTGAFDMSLKALNANPWVALLMAAVSVIKQVIAAFKGNEEATMALKQAFSAFNPIIDATKRGLESFANLVVNVVTKTVNGLTSAIGWLLEKTQELGNFFGADWHMGDNFKAGVTAARELQAAENDYIKHKREWSVESAKIDRDVADLREKAADKEKYNAKERLVFLDEAIALETKKAAKEKELAEENLRILQREAMRTENSAEMNDRLAEAERAVIEADKQLSDTKRNLSRQRNSAISEINSHTNATKENTKAIADNNAELEKQDEEYRKLTETEMQKAEDALNALIADEYEQRRAIEETAYRRKMEALQKSMKEEEDAHGKDTDLYRSYLSQLESLRRQHEQTMSDIAQDQFQNEQELRNNAIKQLEADNDLYWQNRINEIIAQGQEAGEVELQMLKDKLDMMVQYTDESDAEFYARRLEAQIAYNNKKKALNEAEMAMEKTKADYMSSIAGSISTLMETVAGENKAMVKASKIVALAEVAIKQGVAIAEAVASSAAGDPYTYALRVAAAIASTVAAMAKAISSINSVKLARGTAYVKGPGTSTSDSVPAMLSVGEGVVNAKGNAMFPGVVQAMNDAGNGIYNPVLSMLRNSGGAPIQVSSQQEAISRMMTASAMREVLQDLDLYVSVEEINRTENRVKAMEQLSTV